MGIHGAVDLFLRLKNLEFQLIFGKMAKNGYFFLNGKTKLKRIEFQLIFEKKLKTRLESLEFQ